MEALTYNKINDDVNELCDVLKKTKKNFPNSVTAMLPENAFENKRVSVKDYMGGMNCSTIKAVIDHGDFEETVSISIKLKKKR